MKTAMLFMLMVVGMYSMPLNAQQTTTPPTGTTNPNSISTVIVAKKSVIDQVIDAAKESKKDIRKIPIEIVRKLAIKYLFTSIGNGIMEFNLCELFDHWSSDKKVGEDGYITINFILVEKLTDDQTTAPVIKVEFYAKVKGSSTPTAGGTNNSGYIAPVNSNGNITMEYDVFGDGEYILNYLECE